MWNRIGRVVGPALMTVGALAGLAFAWTSTLDYASHLDRQVHDLRCGVVPGVVAAPGADEGCRAALYSPYAAFMRDKLWGGIPISTLAIGAFSFLAAFALHQLIAGRKASRRSVSFLGVASVTPLLVSLFMAYLAATRLGTFCKTCLGIYFSSAVLATGGILALLALPRETSLPVPTVPDGRSAMPSPLPERPEGKWAFVVPWLIAMALCTTSPAFAYLKSAPNHDARIAACGTIEKPLPAKSELAMKMTFGRATGATKRLPVTLIVDPLCPSCKALHKRLDADGFLEQMDIGVLLFPLDDACNWMVDRPVHAGACDVAKAVYCGHKKGQGAQVLEFAYENQAALTALAKGKEGKDAGKAALAMLESNFSGLGACVADKATGKALDAMLRFAVANGLPVSTPQLVLGDKRLCEEDTDMGLIYSLKQLAPELARPLL